MFVGSETEQEILIEMEYSYSVSEKQYLQALRLKFGAGSRAVMMKIIVFWVLFLACLVLLFSVIQWGGPSTAYSSVRCATNRCGRTLY